jgi:hypothetical protein
MKTSFFILLLMASPLVIAQDRECSSLHPELDDLLKMSKHIEWEAASINDVKKAHCLRKTNITEQEMNNWLATNQSSDKVSKKINGISFENESPENLKSFQFLTNATNFFGRPDPSRQKSFSSKCKKVDCAVKEIFGKEVGTQLLFMQRKYGMNGSHIARDNSSSWKKSELDVILLSLTDFPEGVLPFEEDRPLVHFSRGYMRGPGQERVIANASVEIFDLWNDQSPEEKRYTLNHELGHALAGVTRIDDNQKWLKLSGWETTTKIVGGKKEQVLKLNKPEKIISKYGLTNNWEDFAESVSAYRYNPKKLKEISPEKYALIKEVIFDNVEYTSEEACKNPKRLSQSVKEKTEQLIKNWKPSAADLKTIGNKCSEQAVSIISAKGSVNLADKDIQNCYQNAIHQQAKMVGLKSIENLPNKEFLAPMLRNMKLSPIQPERMKAITTEVRNTHKAFLKSQFNKALRNDYFFKPSTTKSEFVFSSQNFDASIGFDPFRKQKEFANITYRASEQIKKNGSLRRWLNLEYSDSEISEQVDAIIK